MGVIMEQGTEGATMLAPVAAAYAVLPVGVATITPGRKGVVSGGGYNNTWEEGGS